MCLKAYLWVLYRFGSLEDEMFQGVGIKNYGSCDSRENLKRWAQQRPAKTADKTHHSRCKGMDLKLIEVVLGLMGANSLVPKLSLPRDGCSESSEVLIPKCGLDFQVSPSEVAFAAPVHQALRCERLDIIVLILLRVRLASWEARNWLICHCG
jgi:hypothetical protein